MAQNGSTHKALPCEVCLRADSEWKGQLAASRRTGPSDALRVCRYGASVSKVLIGYRISGDLSGS